MFSREAFPADDSTIMTIMGLLGAANSQGQTLTWKKRCGGDNSGQDSYVLFIRLLVQYNRNVAKFAKKEIKDFIQNKRIRHKVLS